MTITVKRELDFWDLMEECWSGAKDTLKTIQEHDKENALMNLLEECFSGDVPTMTEVNDLLRFDDEWLFETLDIDDPYGEENENTE